MRLLYVVNIARFFVSHRLPLAQAARAAGYEVHVATSDADAENIARIRAAGFIFHPLPLAQHGTNLRNEFATLRALIALYRHLQPHIVHHVSIKPVLYGGIAARLTGVRAVVSAMSGLGYVFMGTDTRRRLLRALIQPLLRLALGGTRTRMVFQNPDDLVRFVTLGIIPQERCVLIKGSGVDTEVFAATPLPSDTPIVLFAGRLMWQKGIGIFVAAAQALHGQARFVIVGYAEPTSPDAVPLAQLDTWEHDGSIEYWGKRDDMPAVIAQSSIVCLPSMYGEGVPKVLIEAAACARPIITTDTPGCREIVQNGENGVLIPPNDAPALIAAVAGLLADRALCVHYGQRGRARVIADFSLDQVVSQMLTLYASIAPRP